MKKWKLRVKSNSGILLILFSGLLIPSQVFSGSKGISNPGKFAAIVKDIDGKTVKLTEIVEASLNNINARESMSQEVHRQVNDIVADLDKVELNTWGEKQQTLPIRAQLTEISYLATVIEKEKIPLFWQAETDSLLIALSQLRDRVRDLNNDVESTVFSNVKSHAQVIDYQNAEVIASKAQRDKIDRFITERKSVKSPYTITVFSWSKPGSSKTDLADKRADKIVKFIESISNPKEIRTINMEKQYNLFQKLFKTEEYQIKEAYKTHTFDDSREKTIGWFLSRAAGPNHLVVLFE